MLEMYAPMVNSPITELANAIDAEQTTIEVVDGSKLPDGPNLAMIGLGENTETILYTQKDGNVLSGVTRGFQGIAKAWPRGTRVARFFAAYDQMAIQENIKTLDQSLATHLNEIATTPGANKIPRADASGKLNTGWLPDVPACRVTVTTTQSVANNSSIFISFGQIIFDNDNIFDSSTPTRLTCKTPGKYLIIGQAIWGQDSTSGAREISIRLNGTTYLSNVYGPPVSNGRVHQVVSTIYDLNVNDYVVLEAKTIDAGKTVTVEPGKDELTSLMMIKVG